MILSLQKILKGSRPMVRRAVFMRAASLLLTLSPLAGATTMQAQSRFDYFYLEAVRQQELEHYDAAFDLLNHCLDIDPQSAEVHSLLSRYYGQMHKDSMMRVSMLKAAELCPDNDDYQEDVARQLIEDGKIDEAIEAYEKLYERRHDRSDVVSVLFNLYRHQRNYPMMLDAMNRLERNEGSSESITLNKVRIYELLGDSKHAYKTLKKLSDDHPYDTNYRVMLGNWLMQNKKEKQAYKIFTDVLRVEPQDPFAQASLYDYYNHQGDTAQARAMRWNMLLSPKTEIKSRMAMMQTLIAEGQQAQTDSSVVLADLLKVQQALPADADVAQIIAAYLTLKKFPQDSINQALLRVVELSPDLKAPRLQLIEAYWKDKQWAEVAKQCRDAINYIPDDMRFYFFLGEAYNMQDDLDNAVAAFKDAVTHSDVFTSKSMKADSYAVMGDILHQQGKDLEAFAAYDSCLMVKDDNAYCLNNYAYFLCERDSDMKRAEQMAYKAIQLEPGNANSLDTYAWILFKEERYAEAQIYIEQALKASADTTPSAVVLAHAGDIMALNGHMDKALEYWQQAVDAGSDEAAMLNRKIKAKKYIKEK